MGKRCRSVVRFRTTTHGSSDSSDSLIISALTCFSDTVPSVYSAGTPKPPAVIPLAQEVREKDRSLAHYSNNQPCAMSNASPMSSNSWLQHLQVEPVEAVNSRKLAPLSAQQRPRVATALAQSAATRQSLAATLEKVQVLSCHACQIWIEWMMD